MGSLKNGLIGLVAVISGSFGSQASGWETEGSEKNFSSAHECQIEVEQEIIQHFQSKGLGHFKVIDLRIHTLTPGTYDQEYDAFATVDEGGYVREYEFQLLSPFICEDMRIGLHWAY